ncbi:hypothetical protein [Rubritalea tangerina]
MDCTPELPCIANMGHAVFLQTRQISARRFNYRMVRLFIAEVF